MTAPRPLAVQLDASSASEAARLLVLEQVIERGFGTFVEVGLALMEVRDSRLYRATHATFEDYCRERWQMGRRRANQLIEAAEVAGTLGTMVPIPENERQARALARLSTPEQQREAWREAAETAPLDDAGAPRITAAHVERVVRDEQAVHYSSETTEWETPRELFDVLNREFAFTLDVCATKQNAKCTHFFTAEQDGLTQDWQGVCWMNPPYGEAIGRWVAKARAASESTATVVCLVPARTDTAWWWDNCRFGEIRFLRGRLRFGTATSSAPFPSAVVIFPRAPTVVWWEPWRTE